MRKPKFREVRTVVIGLVALLALGSCSSMYSGVAPRPASVGSEIESVAPTATDTSVAVKSEAVKGEAVKGMAEASPLARSSMIIKGTDQIIAPAKDVVLPKSAAKDVSFKFEQAPVRDVVQAVLGDLMGFSYVIHQQLSGTVSISTAGPVPADQALSLLEAVMQANGILMVMDGGGVFHVGTPEALRGIVPVPKRVEKSPLTPGSGTVIVPLKYIGAAEMAEILRPLARPEAFVRVDTLRNMLILAGSRNQIDGWLEIVRTFDIDLLKGMSVAVFPLQYISVSDIEEVMKAIASSTSATTSGGAATGGAAAAPSAPRPAGAASSTPGAAGAAASSSLVSSSGSETLSKNPFLGASRIIPLERLNSLLVITTRASYLDDMKRWLERLDRPSSNDGAPRLFVYPVQNGTAQHLASVLGSLFGGTGTTGSSGVAPGLRSASGGTTQSSLTGGLGSSNTMSGGIGSNIGGMTGTNSLFSSQQGGTRPNAVSAASLGAVKIVADDLNNSIIVYAAPAEYAKIEAALRQLDQPATQVLIEATIAEVSLTGDLQYGLQWYFNDTARHGLSGAGQLNLNSSGEIAASQPGFSYTWTNSAGAIRGVLNALASRSLIRVISSPTLTVQDNYPAAISVGDQVPIQSGTVVTTGGNVTSSIQYKDTGVQLNVTPTVNSSDMVSMTISQGVTDVGAIDAATGQRGFLQRQIASRVVVKSGEALVLGGLIRDNTTSGSSGIPILSEIPILGALFGGQTKNNNRTELIVVITPRVIRSPQDSRFIGNEMRDRMRGVGDLFEERRWLLPPALKDLVPERVPQQLPAESMKP